jgi:long-chain acyl-CoA synthetase
MQNGGSVPGIMKRANLLSLFEQFGRYSKDVAFVQRRGYRREAWTYEKLMLAAAARAMLLKKEGVRSRDRVLLWGRNSAEWAATFWGCLLRGAVVVALDETSTAEFASRVAADAGAKLAFVSGSKPQLSPAVRTLAWEHLSAGLAKEMPAIQRVPGPGSARLEVSVTTLADEPITREHVAEILFTSGTTSEPHGVVLTHGNFLANLEALEAGIEPYRKWEWWFHPLRFVSVVPLSHVFGQFMALFVPPLLGATVILENSAVPGEILRTIQRERASTLIAVPRMIEGLQHAIERDVDSRGWKWFGRADEAAAGRSFLRRAWQFRRLHRRLGWNFWAFISGGAALSTETEEFFKRIGYAVVQGYGMTETASLISVNHPFRAAEGTVGKILPGCEFRLAEDGEILVRGENVAFGYWEKGAFRKTADGWLHTGDLGRVDEQGNLRFRGRKKSVIVTPSGLNVYPEDLEAALKKQPGIRDAVVLPLQVGRNAEPCGVLLSDAVSANGRSAESQVRAAIDAANATLADYQRIRKWVIWPEADFPRASTGKPRLAAIAARTGELLGAKASEGSGRLLGAKIPSDTLGMAAAGESLKDLSSLDRVELLASLEQRYNVELNETQFANAQSFAEIEQLLAQPTARRSDYPYPRWTQRAPVRLFRLLVYYALTWPATLLLGHPRVCGRERLANLKGPALFVANHTTRRADIGLILLALPMRFRHRLAAAMGGETLQTFRHPPREWLFLKRWLWQLGYFLVVSLFNVFPLPQFSGFRESFRFAGESVDRGYSLLVFPEGVINDRGTPEMVSFQAGIGLLAQNLGIPVVPMRLDGVWKMKQEHRRFAHLGEVTIHIGAPITVSSEASAAEIAEQLQFAVKYL